MEEDGKTEAFPVKSKHCELLLYRKFVDLKKKKETQKRLKNTVYSLLPPCAALLSQLKSKFKKREGFSIYAFNFNRFSINTAAQTVTSVKIGKP